MKNIEVWDKVLDLQYGGVGVVTKIFKTDGRWVAYVVMPNNKTLEIPTRNLKKIKPQSSRART